MKNLIIVAIAIISLTLTSCQDSITGEGMVVTENFDFNNFSELELKSFYDVVVTQGTDQKVEVKGQQNVIDKMILFVSNETFVMDMESGNYRNVELTVYITVPTLDKVTVDGSGDIEIKEMESDDLEIKMSGSGDITAKNNITITDKITMDVSGSGDIQFDNLIAKDVTATMQGSGDLDVKDGSAEDLLVTANGSGDIEIYGLQSEDCTVTSKGSGDTQVRSTNTLEVNLTGSGDVKYKGNPTITVTDTGSGELINAN